MARIRIVWSRLWNILSSYFTEACCHADIQVKSSANYLRFTFVIKVSKKAIDALRQLAIKFLAKEELRHYSFQNKVPTSIFCSSITNIFDFLQFLAPFEAVMRRTAQGQVGTALLQICC